MSLICRLLLTLALLLQPLAGSELAPCERARPAAASDVESAACPCCTDGVCRCDPGATEGACNLAQQRPEAPKVPPRDSDVEQGRVFLALAPDLLGVVLSVDQPLDKHPAPQASFVVSAATVRALLCVWLM